MVEAQYFEYSEHRFEVRRIGFVDSKGVRKNLLYPPVQGTHPDCFKELAKRKAVILEGNDLTRVAEDAYTQNTPVWKAIKANQFVNGYTRIPVRMSFNPSKKEPCPIFPGVLVQRDLKGIGLTAPFIVPSTDSDEWVKRDRIYVHKTGIIYVPEGEYFLGEHKKGMFEKDGLAIAVLEEEGAQRYEQTGRDNKLPLKSWGVDITKINQPLVRVGVLNEFGGRLNLYCYFDGSYSDGYAFGCVLASAGGASVAQNEQGAKA
jgi:hypothetical protein